jgi:hypothetical protein
MFRPMRACFLMLPVLALVVVAGCVFGFPSDDPCSEYNLRGPRNAAQVTCDGNVLVLQRTVCDSSSGQYVPDGPPTRQDCEASQSSCYEAACRRRCTIRPDCAEGEYCSYLRAEDGQRLCEPLPGPGASCQPDVLPCAPGFDCQPEHGTPGDDSNWDGARGDAADGARGNSEDAADGDGDAGDGSSFIYTCQQTRDAR